ncbi:MAG: hypothetical protein WBO97_14940, partial [Tepidiformaceae bacterium]
MLKRHRLVDGSPGVGSIPQSGDFEKRFTAPPTQTTGATDKDRWDAEATSVVDGSALVGSIPQSGDFEKRFTAPPA